MEIHKHDADCSKEYGNFVVKYQYDKARNQDTIKKTSTVH